MKSKIYGILATVIVLLLIGGGWLYWQGLGPVETEPTPSLLTTPGEIRQATSYDECVNFGGVVLASLPSQCRTASGQTFTNPDGIFGRAVYDDDCTELEEINPDGTMETVVVCR